MQPHAQSVPIISIHSHKGGTGKTTIAALLGLAIQHRTDHEVRVCLIDLDLAAPGLCYALGMGTPQIGLLDWVMADPETEEAEVSAGDVCVTCDLENIATQLSYDETEGQLLAVPSRPDIELSQAVQPYLLAEMRGHMLSARLQVLLEDLQEARKVELFILDNPPSLMSTSVAARELIDRNVGARVYVTTDTLQDLNGLWRVLRELNEQRREATSENEDTDTPRTETIVLNRWDHRDSDNIQDSLQERLMRSVRGTTELPRAETELYRQWLEQFDIRMVHDSQEISKLLRGKKSVEGLPQLAHLLDNEIPQMAHDLVSRVTGEDPSKS